MISISPDIWAKLQKSNPPGDQLVARPAFPETSPRLLSALDSESKRHLLIPLNESESEYQDSQSRGLSVLTRELTAGGQPITRYLDIECHDVAGYPALDLLGAEIAAALSKGENNSTDVVRKALAKWRRFWGQVPVQLLSVEQQLGLFAELWFLLKWCLSMPGTTAVTSWKGPLRHRHDFQWSQVSVEVKSTLSSRGRVFHIHGLDQLMEPKNGTLYLFGLRARVEPSAGQNLPDLIEDCKTRLVSDADALSQFEELLMQAGYLSVHDEEYSRTSYQVIEERLFHVADDFPRLAMETPIGVEQIEYDVNLNGFDHLIAAIGPLDWQCPED